MFGKTIEAQANRSILKKGKFRNQNIFVNTLSSEGVTSVNYAANKGMTLSLLKGESCIWLILCDSSLFSEIEFFRTIEHKHVAVPNWLTIDSNFIPRFVFEEDIYRSLWSYLNDPMCLFTHPMCIDFCLGITRGLHKLHQMGIECRELSTSSVILVPNDEYQYRI